MNLKYRNSCRICGNTNLVEMIDIGDQFLQGSFEKGDLPVCRRKIPTKLVRCDTSKSENACGLIQTVCTVPPQIMYSNYHYLSGISKTMRDHLKSIVKTALEKTHGKKDVKRVLDVASNDNSLLKSYPTPTTIERYGVDPSDISKAQQGTEGITNIHDFFPSPQLQGKKFDIITSVAVIYDLDEPNVFVKAIKDSLEKNGLWCFEMAYLPCILDNLCFDTFCLEHLEHYHLAPIEYLLKTHGLKIADVKINDINGGSIQVWATHEDCDLYDDEEAQKRLFALRLGEFNRCLDTDAPYAIFRERVAGVKRDLVALIEKIKGEGKTIHLYASSTKGNVLIQYAGIDSKIVQYAAERSEGKFGAKTIGTNIKIISEEESRAMLKPGDYYLVTPWHFKKEILEREKDTINNKQIRFIFPLPKVEVIDRV